MILQLRVEAEVTLKDQNSYFACGLVTWLYVSIVTFSAMVIHHDIFSSKLVDSPNETLISSVHVNVQFPYNTDVQPF